MSLAYQSFRERRFFGSLDGLRTLAILGVIWAHAWYGTLKDGQTIPFDHAAGLGVELFFAISGMLITTLLLRECDQRGTISLRDFFIRRALRIWPLYYTVLGIYILIVPFTEHDPRRRATFFHNLPTFATYTYTWFGSSLDGTTSIFNFAWSLSTEEQFYIFWPFLIKFLPRNWPIAAATSAIILRLLSLYHVTDPLFPPGTVPSNILGNISASICLGAILAHLLHHPRTFDIAHRLTGWKFAAPIFLAAAIALAYPFEPISSPQVWIVLPLLVAACVVREDSGLAPLLRWKPMATIGVLSYGMYLWCNLAIKGMRIPLDRIGLHNPLVAFPFELAATVLVAWLSYRFLERPFLKLKKRFARVEVGEPV